MNEDSILRFVFISFMIQIMIGIPITMATAGSTMLDNTVAQTVIQNTAGDFSTETNQTVVDTSDLDNIASGNPLLYITAALFNAFFWIQKIGTISAMLLMNIMTVGINGIAAGAAIGGTTGAIIGMLGGLYLVWQISLVSLIIYRILR